MREEEIKFITKHLDDFGNCAIGRKIIVLNKTEVVLKTLNECGYKCTLEIVPDNGTSLSRNSKYPQNATYILKLID